MLMAYQNKLMQDNYLREEDNTEERVSFRLPDSTREYYKEVSWKLGIDPSENIEPLSESEKKLFLKNVIKQLQTEAYIVSKNQTVSHVVEGIVRLANVNQLSTFLRKLSEDWVAVVKDPFASHVAQTCLMIAYARLYEDFTTKEHSKAESSDSDSDEDENDVADVRSDLILVVCNCSSLLMDYLERLGAHPYASHVLRALVQLLSGVTLPSKLLRSKSSREYCRRQHFQEGKKYPESSDNSREDVSTCSSVEESQVPPKFVVALEFISKRFFSSEDLADFLYCQCANPLLQSILFCLSVRRPSICHHYCKSILASTLGSDSSVEKGDAVQVTQSLGDDMCSQLVQMCVSLCDVAALDWIFTESCLRLPEGLVAGALHHKANHVVRELVRTCRSKEMFVKVYRSLMVHAEDIFLQKHCGVLQAVAEGCVKWNCRQDKYIKRLMVAFQCRTPDTSHVHISRCLLLMRVYDSSDDVQFAITEYSNVSLHGSLLLQELFHFDSLEILILSFLDFSPEELSTVCCSPTGSHVIGAFFRCKNVPESKKDILLTSMSSILVEVACQKNGSRVLEDIWGSSLLQRRKLLVELLKSKSKRLQGDRFGRFVARALMLPLFVSHVAAWTEAVRAQIKKSSFLQDIKGSSGNRKRKIPEEKQRKVKKQN